MKLSFLAMLCGWVACNIAWWVGAVPSTRWLTDLKLARDLVMIAVCTGIVVLLAWLVIFLPTDLLVRDTSKLRRPCTAACCGFLAAFAIVLAVFVVSAWNEVHRFGLVYGIRATWSLAALPYALGTCATGTVAAYVRARMDNPQPTETP